MLSLPGNWNGFHDDESGIGGYTWAVGTKICGTDIVSPRDPHEHLAHKSHWTHSAHEYVSLPDGEYYFTVQALNDIIFGGPMVTTLCHSVPLVVDNTPPVFAEDETYVYDSDFNVLMLLYNATDEESHIGKVMFAMGSHKYDISLRPYQTFSAPHDIDGSLAVNDVDIEEGKYVWLRLMAYNKGYLIDSSLIYHN